jgi:hypothetical protein
MPPPAVGQTLAGVPLELAELRFPRGGRILVGVKLAHFLSDIFFKNYA